MSCIPVIWWNNLRPEIRPSEQWDAGMLHWLFHNELKDTGHDFVYAEATNHVPHAVVVVAARHHVDEVEALNEYIARYDGVVLILLGDEEAVFPWRQVVHPNLRFWVMMPHPRKHADLEHSAYFFGTGCRADTRELLAEAPQGPREVNWYFGGQVTHARRRQLVDGLSKAAARVPGLIERSAGFTQGTPRPAYLATLAETKIAPCPSGPVTADSMRLYEALEAGCLPIVDQGPDGGLIGFWEFCYGRDFPIQMVHDWTTVGGIFETEVSPARYPLNTNLIQAWWRQYKWQMADRLVNDLVRIGVPAPEPTLWSEQVTAIITASPIEGDIGEYLGLTIGSALDEGVSQFVIAFDGVRSEQTHLAERYHRQVQAVMADYNDGRFNFAVSAHHRHQRAMTLDALRFVDTPVVLFMEQDTPFKPDRPPIPWQRCVELLVDNHLDVIRFGHDYRIHPEHEHLMVDPHAQMMNGVPLRRTRQFSARPHLARTAWYRDVLMKHFSFEANCFIEDKMHSVCQSNPYADNRLAIFTPDGDISVSWHADARSGAAKYDSEQRF